ncbi:MAG TPA: GDP-L-fucose synthase [Thermoanaerobaculia bacterium]|nr:GDP-L-fucose synthase [Thermoanaerobaculia bacterium]
MRNPLEPMRRHRRIFVAGARGLVGSAIVRRLQRAGHDSLLMPSHADLDLTDQSRVRRFFSTERPELVFLSAGKVGGIQANATQQADFLYENVMIAANVIRAAADSGVEKLLYLGSSCIYPREAPQPIPESALLTGPLEPTNEGYAIAKIAGLKMCEMFHRQYGKRFISAMSTNLYGPFDNFHPTGSHVIPGMMRRFHEAKISGAGEVVVWGSGRPRREFLHVDDLADALYVLMQQYEDAETINVGAGEDIAIADLAAMMKEATGLGARVVFDHSKPDGMPRKLLDSRRMRQLGWSPAIPLAKGLSDTYRWALENVFAPVASR